LYHEERIAVPDAQRIRYTAGTFGQGKKMNGI
jgi:hypothetical protein